MFSLFFFATYEREGSEISTHTKKGTNLIDAISKYNMGGGFEDLVMGRVFSQSTGFLPEHPNETQVFFLVSVFCELSCPHARNLLMSSRFGMAGFAILNSITW